MCIIFENSDRRFTEGVTKEVIIPDRSFRISGYGWKDTPNMEKELRKQLSDESETWEACWVRPDTPPPGRTGFLFQKHWKQTKRPSWEWEAGSSFFTISIGESRHSTQTVAECFEKRLMAMMGRNGHIVDITWRPSKCQIAPNLHPKVVDEKDRTW